MKSHRILDNKMVQDLYGTGNQLLKISPCTYEYGINMKKKNPPQIKPLQEGVIER